MTIFSRRNCVIWRWCEILSSTSITFVTLPEMFRQTIKYLQWPATASSPSSTPLLPAFHHHKSPRRRTRLGSAVTRWWLNTHSPVAAQLSFSLANKTQSRDQMKSKAEISLFVDWIHLLLVIRFFLLFYWDLKLKFCGLWTQLPVSWSPNPPRCIPEVALHR